MTGTFLFCWAVFPAMALLLCAGAGLLVRRLCGPLTVSAVLVVPVGLALLVVVGGLLCYWESLAPLAAPAFALIGVAGLLLERRTLVSLLRRRRVVEPWALLAGFGAWIVVAAPVLLSGRPGFSGYAHIVDISYELDLSVHLAHAGRAIPAGTSSAYQTVMHKYLGTGYPGGGPWTLGALSNLTPVDLSWLYQPFLALVSGCTGLSLYALLRRLIAQRPLRALAALVAAQPNVLMGYALAGGIKELCTASFLALAAALLAAPRFRPALGRSGIAVSIAIAATISSLTLTTLPWVAALSAGACLTISLLQPGMRARILALLGSAQIGLLGLLLAIPTLVASLKLIPTVSAAVAGPPELGNLSQPVPGIAAAGVWISGDIRFPQYAHAGLSEALAVLVLVLAVLGALHAIRRRAWGALWLGIAGGVALLYVRDQHYAPWIQLKADCITATTVLAMAFAGAGALIRLTRRWPAGALPLVVIAAAVLGGNALLYHDTPIAPYKRLRNLQYIGERYAGQGPTLTPDFEEDAEYYLRDMDQTSMVNGPTLDLNPEVNRATEPGGIYAYDINEFSLPWLEGFKTIVMRRRPVASRPPANYRLVYISPYYEVWQRERGPASVYAHVRLTDAPGQLRGAACRRVQGALRSAGPGASVVYEPSPQYIQIDSSNTVLKGGFGNGGGAIVAVGAGTAVRRQPIPSGGLYDLYMGGSIGRPVDVSIDGRHVAKIAYEISYPYQWQLIGSVRLSAGVHRIEIERGGVSLHPDNGDGIDGLNRTIGPLIIQRADQAVPSLVSTGAAGLAQLCASRTAALRWVEVVRPGAGA